MVRWSDNDSDYHLRVVSYCGNPESRSFEYRVDGFLEDLYNVEVPGRPTIQPPLAFSECRLSEHDGRPAALIRFQLSRSGARSLTLDGALADFCEKIFKPNASSIARTLSSRSILGLSAISQIFRRMWNNSLFRQILSEREEFLRRIEEGFNDEYLPDWALASSFASFTGAIFLGSLTERHFASGLRPITADSISACIIIATSILVNFSTRVDLANPDLQQKRWDISHKEFKRGMERVMRTITRLTVSQDDNCSNDLLYADLCEHLYDAIAAAAKTHIANRELFLAYVELHKEAHASMIANTLKTEAYLTTLAFSVTTTTAAVPLSQWGLADAVGWLLLGELPMVQTTSFCPPLAALSVACAAYFGWSRYQDKKKRDLFAKKVDYHRKLKAFIVQAWKIAHLTHTLRLVHCIAADRMAVEFVNDSARTEWRNTITKFNEARGRTTPGAQLEPSFIMVFLDEQRRDFEAWHQDLAAHEAQIVSELQL